MKKKGFLYIIIGLVALSLVSSVIYVLSTGGALSLMDLEEIEEKLQTVKTEKELASLYSELDSIIVNSEHDTVKIYGEKIKERRSEYSDGLKERQISHGKSLAYLKAKEEIKRRLKSPSTANYQNYENASILYDEKDEAFVVKMWVEAQNSFGATIRSDYLVRLSIDYSGNLKLTSFHEGN